MKFVTINAEQQACKYIATYKKHTIYSRAAFFELSATKFSDIGQRSLIKNFFLLELNDPKSVIFQFENGDIFILSENLTNHHVFKAARYFGLDRYLNGRLYKMPHHYEDVALILSKYLEKYKNMRTKAGRKTKGLTLRDRFLDVKISSHLAGAMDKIRSERDELKILVIDDDEFALRLIQRAVGRDYSVDVAQTAVDGFKKYAHSAADIVFLDINMPSVSGHDFLSKIFDLDPNAYIVMVSGHSDEKNMRTAQQLGAKGFISKPYAQEEIYRYIYQYTHRPENVA